MGGANSRACSFSASTPAAPLLSPDATVCRLFVAHRRIMSHAKAKVKALDVQPREGYSVPAWAYTGSTQAAPRRRRDKKRKKHKKKRRKDRERSSSHASVHDDESDEAAAGSEQQQPTPVLHSVRVDNDVTSVIVTARASSPAATVRARAHGGAEVEELTLAEARLLGLAPRDDDALEPPRPRPLSPDDPPRPAPPAGEPLCFRVTRVPAESCDVDVVVTAEDGAELTYTVEVRRRPWVQNAWQPGTERDRYRWYCHGAQDGLTVAQYALGLMYAGEDGRVPVPRGQAATADLDALESLLDVRQEEERAAAEAARAAASDAGWQRPDSASSDALLEPIDADRGWVRHFYWVQRAADQGHLESQQRLAALYAEGRVPREVLDEALRREQAAELAQQQRRQAGDDGDDGDAEATDGDADAAPLDPAQRMAAKWLLRAARAGDQASARRLGRMYLEGRGVQMSYKQAAAWLRRSGLGEAECAEQVTARLEEVTASGDRRAAYQLGLMRVEGGVAEPDYAKAMHWFARAMGGDQAAAEARAAELFEELAAQGDSAACVQLARMHIDGAGVDMDYKRALFWLERAGRDRDESYEHVAAEFRRAAERGDEGSCYQMALLHVDGVGVHTDYKKALDWFVLAGCDRDEMARFTAERFEAAAEKGNPRSAYQLALMYVDGVGAPMDYVRALQWMDRAGAPPQEATRQAAAWFTRNAADGDSRSAYQLALMHCDGVGVEHDYKRALEWLAKAGQSHDFACRFVAKRFEAPAARRDVASCFQLASMYMAYPHCMQWLVDEGREEFWFHEQAARLFIVAGEEGHHESALKLGHMYVDGQGVPINFKAAAYWFERAGKSKVYSNRQKDKKLKQIKPHYKRLFKEYAERSGGSIDLPQFAGFYRDCLMAKGIARDKADEETRGLYQGRPKYEVLFSSYDINRDQSLDFDEVWAHPHTHTSLFPKTGRHVMAANAYFGKPHPLARDQSIRAFTGAHMVETVETSGSLSARGNGGGGPAPVRRSGSRSPRRPHTARARTRSGELSRSGSESSAVVKMQGGGKGSAAAKRVDENDEYEDEEEFVPPANVRPVEKRAGDDDDDDDDDDEEEEEEESDLDERTF